MERSDPCYWQRSVGHEWRRQRANCRGSLVANTAGNTFSSPNVNWNGGGGNGIQYDHCWADYMISKVPPLTPAVNASALQVISLRTLVY